jgi:hypothetical protein
MAAQTYNVNGVAVLRILLSTATIQLFLTNAQDGQQLILILQQDGTGGRLVTSGNIPGIGSLDSAANSDTIYTLVYDASINSWNVQNVSFGNASLSAPQVVGVLNSAAVGFADYTTAGVLISTLLPAGAPAGTYRLSLYGVITTTLTGNSVAAPGLTLGYTDDDQAVTKETVFSGGTAAGNVAELVYVFRSTGAAAVTLTGVCTTGNPTAGVTAVSAVLERVA